MDTFVIRIFTPAPGAGDLSAPPSGLNGTAHHVVSGRSGIFRSEEQLVRLLAQLRSEAAADERAAAEDAAARPVAV